MKVKFILDKKYDGLMIWEMLKSDDPSGAKNRAKSMGISEKELEKIYGTKSFKEVEEFINSILEAHYDKAKERITKALKEYQKSWDQINDLFSDKIEKITGHKWKFEEYLVVLSPFHPGISNRKENKVIRWIWEDATEQRRITAHEILMIHIWDIFDKKLVNYYKDSDEENQKMHLWALNEITTIAILGLEPELDDLWSDDLKGYDRFLANYPKLDNLKMELKKIYLKEESFQNYLDKAVSLLKSEYSGKSFAF